MKTKIYNKTWFIALGAAIMMATIFAFVGVLNSYDTTGMIYAFIFAFGLAFTVFCTLHNELLILRKDYDKQKRLSEYEINQLKERNEELEKELEKMIEAEEEL